MLIKGAILFLLVMAGMGLFGSFRVGRAGTGLRGPKLVAKFCSACGRPRIGQGPCPCGKA
jgi:hypothetical protein